MQQIPNEIIEQFSQWYQQAKSARPTNYNAMTLATANAEHRPDARTVLLKHFDEHGFVFYTNLDSKKGHDLEQNPQASLCFYWHELGKQIRISGHVEKISDEEANQYFASRSRDSQLSAWASHQSKPILEDGDFEKKIEQVHQKFPNDTAVPRPEFWAGFRVIPDKIEFWEEGDHRRHIRDQYQLIDGRWLHTVLYP